MAEHPKERVARARQTKPTQLLDDDDLVEDAIVFLHENALLQTNCGSLSGRLGKLRCSCWKTFLPEGVVEDGVPLETESAESADEYCATSVTVSVARYMVYFCKLEKQQQQAIVLEWLRYAEIVSPPNGQFKHCTFIIPLLHDGFQMDRSKLPLICKSTMMQITGRCTRLWLSCSKALKNGRIPEHGLKGRPSNRATPFENEVKEDLAEFFEVIKNYAEPPIATTYVQEMTGTTERDADTEKLLLPPYWTKRSLYGRFCLERGWKIATNAKGTNTVEERIDADWADEWDRLPICSWRQFHRYWKQNIPELVSRKPNHRYL
jgi:hypothetical protein